MQIIVDNLDVEYEQSGTGPVVLFLHGWGTHAQTFAPLQKELGNARQYVSVSLPGFGNSQLPPKPWSVHDYAQFVTAFTQKLDIRPDVIVAHSFGGRIAVKAIANNLLAPNKLVLIGAAGLSTRTMTTRATIQLVRIAKALTSIPPLSRLQSPLRKLLGGRFTSPDYRQAKELKETFALVVDEHLGDDVRKIRVPTLLIWGENDKQTPVADARAFHQHIPGSQLFVIPGADHFVYRQQPSAVARLMQTFLC